MNIQKVGGDGDDKKSFKHGFNTALETLEKKEEQIVMSKDEFEKAIRYAFDAGKAYELSSEGDSTAPGFEEYFNTVIK